jgi:hypothetical protein
MILVGCGSKETPQAASRIPTNTAEVAMAIPSMMPVEATSTEVPATPLLPSPTQEPSKTSTATLVPTETALPTPVGMSLTQWTLWGWTSSTSPMACQDTNSPCWMLTDYKSISSLENAEAIYIDPAWVNPSLVFQTRYSIKNSKAFGFVEIEVEGAVGWNRMYTLKGSKDYWHEVSIDLSEFSGKTIALRFCTKPYANITTDGEATKVAYTKQSWIIQNIVITAK